MEAGTQPGQGGRAGSPSLPFRLPELVPPPPTGRSSHVEGLAPGKELAGVGPAFEMKTDLTGLLQGS